MMVYSQKTLPPNISANNKACNIPNLIFNQNTVFFSLFLQIAQFEKELSVFQWQNHNEPDQEKNPICALLYVCK